MFRSQYCGNTDNTATVSLVTDRAVFGCMAEMTNPLNGCVVYVYLRRVMRMCDSTVTAVAAH